MNVETDAKKPELAQISQLLKNSQFLPYCNETLSKCLAHEKVLSLEYQLDRRENEDFLLIVNSWASYVSLAPVSIQEQLLLARVR